MEYCGIPELDDQHLGLFIAVDRARLHITKGNDFIGLLELLAKLEDFADRHFALEEEYMVKFNYPGLEDHKKEHKRFKEIAQKHVDELRETGEPATAILDFVEAWLHNHIDKECVLFRTYLK